MALLAWPALEPPAAPQALPATANYRCAGDPLRVRYEAGAVAAPEIPNILAGTLPGAFVAIDWRGWSASAAAPLQQQRRAEL